MKRIWGHHRFCEVFMKNHKPVFAQRLAALRKRKGLTQTDLADKLDVSLEMIKYYETRAEHPNSAFLLKIRQVFGVNIDELICDGSKNKPGPESELEKCFDKVAHLPKRQQQKVVAVIEAMTGQPQ